MKPNILHDSLYATQQQTVTDFIFDETVANVFENMIQRSVPGYLTIISMIGVLAERYAQAKSHCYDLGCSLGAATLSMRRHIQQPNCRIIAVDNSPAMVAKCQQNIQADDSQIPVDIVCADILNVKFQNASVVVLNFTLQFVQPDLRFTLLKKIYNGMVPGGVLIFSEKIVFPDQQRQKFQIDLHHAFKKANGYSELEISQKRTALENVLIPDTLACHQQRLRAAGFRFYDVWFQCFNFISMLALK